MIAAILAGRPFVECVYSGIVAAQQSVVVDQPVAPLLSAVRMGLGQGRLGFHDGLNPLVDGALKVDAFPLLAGGHINTTIAATVYVVKVCVNDVKVQQTPSNTRAQRPRCRMQGTQLSATPSHSALGFKAVLSVAEKWAARLRSM